jgi:hypothetical protein
MRPILALAALATLLAPAAAPAATASRAAIVVGANAAALGRAALRHAHRDSEAIAEVLRTVGRFDAARVHVLRDPPPEEVLRLVEREAAALAGDPRGLLLFYYSGHSDRDALYPGGKPLALERLRAVLDRPDVAVRIGVIDACQGGAWTRAKGLEPDAPFEVTIPAVLGSEGSALIASSSGLESAHESDLLQGSFFTVHFAAALRGAGDRSGDGAVTLTEAFDYARERTIRDSARLSPEPQHPSYALNVRGRQDIVLAHVSDSPSTLAVEQREGPLELVHLASGLRVLELPGGERSVTLAVPPGKYLVRKVTPEGIRTRELAVPRDGVARVAEGELVLLADERLAAKGAPRRTSPGALERGSVEMTFLYGSPSEDRWPSVIGERVGTGVDSPMRLDALWAITDRLVWRVGTLGFAYRFRGRNGRELVPYAGVLGWAGPSAAPVTVEHARVGAGLDAYVPLGSSVALVAGVGGEHEKVPGRWDQAAHATVGLSARVGDATSLHLGVRAEVDRGLTLALNEGLMHVRIGSVQELGLAALPMVRYQASPRWSIDVHASIDARSRFQEWRDWNRTVFAGATALF